MPRPVFTDEQQYLFLARPVCLNEKGARIDNSETIAESREFTLEQCVLWWQKNIIQDANTACSFCATLCAWADRVNKLRTR